MGDFPHLLQKRERLCGVQIFVHPFYYDELRAEKKEAATMKRITVLVFLIATASLTGCASGGASLTAHEEKAVDFIDTMYNEADREQTKTFIEREMHPDAKPLFLMAASGEAEEGDNVEDIHIDGSVQTESEGEQVDIVKAEAKNADGEDATLYVMYMEDKIAWLVRSDKADSEESRDMLNEFENLYESNR